MNNLESVLRESAFALIDALSDKSDLLYSAFNGSPVDSEKFTDAANEILNMSRDAIVGIQKGLGTWSNEPEEKLSDFDTQKSQAEFVIYQFFTAMSIIKLVGSDALSSEIESAVARLQRKAER